MERIKVASLAIIALALAVELARDLVPEARAATGDIVCNAWLNEALPLTVGPKKMMEESTNYANSVRVWMLQHPGEPVFRATKPYAGDMVDIVCVRQ